MTNTTTGSEEVFKVDARGRVQTQRARREELLDEFERSGASGQAFAAMVGVKYQTFASWIQKRRRARGQYPATAKAAPSIPTTGTLRLVEAVIDRELPAGRTEIVAGGLCMHLPGGARVEVHDARQAALAAELLKALASTRPC